MVRRKIGGFAVHFLPVPPAWLCIYCVFSFYRDSFAKYALHSGYELDKEL
jgi:hypothetical protein